METTDLMAGQIKFALANVCNNLDFIPDDKLNWKPAPTANSVMEIVNHVAGSIYHITAKISNDEQDAQFTPAANRDEAKMLLQKGVEKYAARIGVLTPQDMTRTVAMPFGEIPMSVASGIPAVELINHHGQITYIQTLLGDTESHIVMG